jgi:hypothetical protein
LLRLRDELKRISDRQGQEFPVSEIESHWALLQECEHAVKRYKPDEPEMAKELWGYLVGVCENIANNAAWEKMSVRWKTVRRILLKAAKDPFPPSDDDRTEGKDEWPSWVSPSPRIDAARGLPALVYRLEPRTSGSFSVLTYAAPTGYHSAVHASCSEESRMTPSS